MVQELSIEPLLTEAVEQTCISEALVDSLLESSAAVIV